LSKSTADLVRFDSAAASTCLSVCQRLFQHFHKLSNTNPYTVVASTVFPALSATLLQTPLQTHPPTRCHHPTLTLDPEPLTKTPTASPPRRPPTSSAFHWYPYHFCVERTQLLSRAILGKGSTRTTPLPLSIFRAGHPRSSSVRIEGSRDRRSPVVDQNSKPPPGCQVQPRR
jgi:hypothetical protein